MIHFVVYGEPVAKARARVCKTGFAYTPEKTVNYENLVKMCYIESKCEKFNEGEMLYLRVKAYFSIPKSASKKKHEQMSLGEIRPIKKPDMSNVIKIIEDALNKIAFNDDSQIVKINAEKYYSVEPRVEVWISKAFKERITNLDKPETEFREVMA